jgi:hypothetical protein
MTGLLRLRADRVSAYYLAKQVADQPARIMSLLLYAAIIYWMVQSAAAQPALTISSWRLCVHAQAHSVIVAGGPSRLSLLLPLAGAP